RRGEELLEARALIELALERLLGVAGEPADDRVDLGLRTPLVFRLLHVERIYLAHAQRIDAVLCHAFRLPVAATGFSTRPRLSSIGGGGRGRRGGRKSPAPCEKRVPALTGTEFCEPPRVWERWTPRRSPGALGTA